MKFLESFSGWLAWAGGLVTPDSFDGSSLQQPLQVHHRPGHGEYDVSYFGPGGGGPVFGIPGKVPNEDQLKCDYSKMGADWEPCSAKEDRRCWLRNKKTGQQYNITTNYELDTPIGMTRRYWLDVDKMTLSGDGYKMTEGKVFNQTYPGPWLEACWGDSIEVTVTNHLKYNGTSIHWHGFRQLNNMEADGVNGITQCPIAGYPMNDSYTYKFKAEQYGTSWYHSHYSLQYGDGLLGPITVYGPSSSNFSQAIPPLMMTDNLHMSAFQAYHREITPGEGPPLMDNILLNGTGIWPCSKNDTLDGKCVQQTSRFNMTVSKGEKYMMRVINTAVDTTFVFSIDNHMLEVVSSDFVPIHPYNTSSILVGIGQRYHVVLHADADGKPPKERSYWIRTDPAQGCYNFGNGYTGGKPPSNTGILYYDGSEQVIPTTSSTEEVKNRRCADEPYDKLKPIVPWKVGYPSNQQENSTFQVAIVPPPAEGPFPPRGNFSRWSLGVQPMWLDFGDPTINHVNTGKSAASVWPDNVVVVPVIANNSLVPKDDQWVYLLITGDPFPFEKTKNRNFLPVAHPIHLHGHDFALIAQSPRPYWNGFAGYELNNPPRRDVALLPASGFLIIAFKADNPGAWIMHCHIAWHASAGLAVQILEKDGSILVNEPKSISETCKNWKKWHNDRNHWYEGMLASTEFQDDSGI